MLDFMKMESERSQHAISHLGENPVLIDPLDKLSEILAVRDVTIDDLIHALEPTDEEVQLIQEMSVGNVTIHYGLMHGNGGSPLVILEGCAIGSLGSCTHNHL